MPTIHSSPHHIQILSLGHATALAMVFDDAVNNKYSFQIWSFFYFLKFQILGLPTHNAIARLQTTLQEVVIN
jgi:hypothetical protein